METKNREEFMKYFTQISRIAARILLVTIVLFCILGIGVNLKNSNEFQTVSIEEGWVDAFGQNASLAEFQKTSNGKHIYYMLPEIQSNQDLFFRTRNMFADVYLDGELIYKDDQEIFPLFGTSSGTRWHAINLPIVDHPVTIRIDGSACYSDSKGQIFDIYFGAISEMHRMICMDRMAEFLLTLMWWTSGIIMLIIYIGFHRFFRLERDFLYLALLTFFAAQWCSVETHMWQFFFGYSEFFHFVGYLSLMSIPVSGGLLACYRADIKWKRAAMIYTLISEANLFVVTVLHLMQKVEFHYTVKTVHILMFLLFPFAYHVVKVFAESDNLKKYKKKTIAVFSLMVFLAIAGIVRYLTGHYNDYGYFVQGALFIFLLLILTYQLSNVVTVFKKGLQSELTHELALTDQLTKFYNRSGFAEHLGEYECALKEHRPFAVVQFDVNNLKKVNDNQGHEKGDELICLASSGIYQSYGVTGRCYRMGGDEFLVVLMGSNPKLDFENGIKDLETYCGYANSVKERTFDVEIAYGFALARPGDTLAIVQERADARMYEKKREMKAIRK